MNLARLILIFVACFFFGLDRQILAEDLFDTAQNVDVSADRLEYDAEKKLLIGSGNVLVQQGEDQLTADFVTVHTESQEAYAAGNVKFNRAGRTWEGEELTYNFNTGEGDFGAFTAFVDPLYIQAEDSTRSVGGKSLDLEGVTLSSCDGEKPEFYITAKSASVEDGHIVRAKHAVFHLGPVPFFYVPYFKYDTAGSSHFDFTPGYGSKWGAYLLSSYNTRINDGVESSTHLDYRSERGFAGGQDFHWETPNMRGKIKAYYANDNSPYENDDDLTDAEKALIDSDRYRIQFEHSQDLTERDYVIAQANYVSDPEFLSDFFRGEYEDEVVPENQISYTHRADNYTFGILLNGRLNDFYESIERLPEVSLDIRRQPLSDSGIYYESQNTATYLKKEYSVLNDTDSYDTFRADTRHLLLYPKRFFGFLNVTPGIGYRGTYYSKTKETTTSTEVSTSVTTNTSGIVSSTTSTSTVSSVTDGGAQWRNIPWFEVETSFQAFREIRRAQNGNGGLRHVAEPYIQYHFNPEPNITSAQLYQFDEIDTYDKWNVVRLGMRNRLQTKRNNIVSEIINLNVYADYDLSAEENSDGDTIHVQNLQFTADSYPAEHVEIRSSGVLDLHGDGVTEYNIRGSLVNNKFGRTGLEYRYLVSDNDLWTWYLDMFPDARWSAGTAIRYQVYGATMEEQSYYVGHKSDCLGYQLGYTGRGDDWTIWFQIYLLAFPNSRLGTSF
ncbi:MAG: hypothetical protein EOL87_15315 [Spartobacteria bacterium]|nr:hypothetical protein [Spartobacteria bacterium]